mmetsp:Transcript_45599/g.120511  ORF Transcript_45599/g.120511 Transcript_45599/m.120511 type:complete len:213 (+) Transcript_45599:1659-2297(+)
MHMLEHHRTWLRMSFTHMNCSLRMPTLSASVFEVGSRSSSLSDVVGQSLLMRSARMTFCLSSSKGGSTPVVSGTRKTIFATSQRHRVEQSPERRGDPTRYLMELSAARCRCASEIVFSLLMELAFEVISTVSGHVDRKAGWYSSMRMATRIVSSAWRTPPPTITMWWLLLLRKLPIPWFSWAMMVMSPLKSVVNTAMPATMQNIVSILVSMF